MVAALSTLREGGMASMTIPKGFPATMDPLTAFALVNAQKAGGLNFIANLTGLPRLDTTKLDALRALSDPALETPQPTS